MGSELQVKYQKLAQEYAKLRSHVDVLKKAVRDEQAQKAGLEESLRVNTLQLRKNLQENESLEFRNQQLSRRVAMLQEELNSPVKSKKKKDGFPGGVSDIHTQELAAKISENERLHMKILELTQKSERSISELETKVGSLQVEVDTNNAVADELSRQHQAQLDRLQQEKALLEARLAQQSSQLEDMVKTAERLQVMVSEGARAAAAANAVKERRPLLDPDCRSLSALNVPVVDTKLQAEVVRALRSGLELMTTFTTQTSTLHSYLEQRGKAYPVDTAAGLHMTIVNQKLCELLHGSSAFTRPLVSTLTAYCSCLEGSPYSQDNAAHLEEFATAHHKFVAFLETLTPYLQLSLQEECNVSVCGSELAETNQRVALSLPMLTAAFSSLGDYITILVAGPARGVPQSSMTACLVKLQAALQDLQHIINDVLGHFSSKISQEYQLPTVSQKLNTTNECVVSSLTGLHSTTQQLCGFVQSNEELFANALEHSSSDADSKQSTLSSVVLKLRARATGYLGSVQVGSVESVPYTLAVYNAKTLSSSSESKDTLLKQVTANHERLSQLEQEKEQLILDLQLLRVKHEKEQKKVALLEHATPHSPSPSPSSSSSAVAPPQTRTLSGSVGSLSVASTEGGDEEPVDDVAMIRKHFVGRIAELNTQVQESDAKATHFYAECRALYKQLNHSTALKSKLVGELQSASDTVQQLQDELATTSSNYEKQLSAMSDHLCELNDRLLQQGEELDVLRRTATGGGGGAAKGGRRRGK